MKFQLIKNDSQHIQIAKNLAKNPTRPSLKLKCLWLLLPSVCNLYKMQVCKQVKRQEKCSRKATDREKYTSNPCSEDHRSISCLDYVKKPRRRKHSWSSLNPTETMAEFVISSKLFYFWIARQRQDRVGIQVACPRISHIPLGNKANFWKRPQSLHSTKSTTMNIKEYHQAD